MQKCYSEMKEVEDVPQRDEELVDSYLQKKSHPYREMRQANGNLVEHSALSFLAEYSDKDPSIQHIRPNIQPIYHLHISIRTKPINRIT